MTHKKISCYFAREICFTGFLRFKMLHCFYLFVLYLKSVRFTTTEFSSLQIYFDLNLFYSLMQLYPLNATVKEFIFEMCLCLASTECTCKHRQLFAITRHHINLKRIEKGIECWMELSRTINWIRAAFSFSSVIVVSRPVVNPYPCLN